MEEDIQQTKVSGWGSMKLYQKVIIVIILVVFLFVFYVVLDANKYRSQVKVVEGEGRAGINPTTEYLDFGDLSRGVTAVRRVNIVNGTFIPMFVTIVKTGDISDLVDISQNNFKLAPGEETRIEFTNYIPASAEVDRIYKGRVYIFKIPTFGL
jgi:hypothetical protein